MEEGLAGMVIIGRGIGRGIIGGGSKSENRVILLAQWTIMHGNCVFGHN